jgi:hypothetical protein
MWSAAAPAAEPVADWSPPPPPTKKIRAAPSSAAPDQGSWSAPPPGAGDDLSPEPAAPNWATSTKPIFAPLAPGASLAGEEEESPRAIDESEAASLLRPVVDDAAAASLLRPVVEDAAAFLRPVENAANAASASRPAAASRPAPVPNDDPDLLVPVEDKPSASAPPGEIVPGEHRVAIHARGGRTRRGSVKDVDLTRAQFALHPQGGGPAEIVAHSELKAIFFMLAPGENAPVPTGKKVRVTFSDGRSIEGHREGTDLRQGFWLVPLDAQKTNTRRIYVAKGAVASVTNV